MIDWTKPIETIDGRAARFVGDYRSGTPQRNVVAVVNGDSSEFLVYVDDNGRGVENRRACIRNVREKRVRWLNMEGCWITSSHLDRDTADKFATSNRTACICIEWQDGDGLDLAEAGEG